MSRRPSGKLKKGVTGKGRTPREGAKLLVRRKDAFDRWKAGEIMKTIAASHKVTITTISLDIQFSLHEWREEHRGSVSQHCEMVLQRLITMQLQVEVDLSRATEHHDRARYYEVLKGCLADQRKLLGLDAPTRTENKTDVTVHRNFKPKDEMLNDVRQRLEQYRSQRAPSNN